MEDKLWRAEARIKLLEVENELLKKLEALELLTEILYMLYVTGQ